MRAGASFSKVAIKQLFTMLERMQSEVRKCRVRHVDFAEGRHGGISVVADRLAFGLPEQIPRLEEGSGRARADWLGLKTENEGGSARWVRKSSHNTAA